MIDNDDFVFAVKKNREVFKLRQVFPSIQEGFFKADEEKTEIYRR